MRLKASRLRRPSFAVAATSKEARQVTADALIELDRGSKVRSVRITDPGTEWCSEDIITLRELAGGKAL